MHDSPSPAGGFLGGISLVGGLDTNAANGNRTRQPYRFLPPNIAGLQLWRPSLKTPLTKAVFCDSGTSTKSSTRGSFACQMMASLLRIAKKH
jgi:hypothetical protein